MKTESVNITKFIMGDVRNLRIAFEVGKVWPGMRDGIVDTFLECLGQKILTMEPSLTTEMKQGPFLVNTYARFCASKPAWGGRYCIALQALNGGEKMLYGVVKEGGNAGRCPICQEVLKAVHSVQRTAELHGWWAAQITMRSPASDWNSADILWLMLNNDKEFLDKVANQLMAVAEVAVPILDKLTQKSRPQLTEK